MNGISPIEKIRLQEKRAWNSQLRSERVFEARAESCFLQIICLPITTIWKLIEKNLALD